MKKLNVGIIGYKFMGKAHSNAWRKAPYFFDLNVEPVLKVACGRHEAGVKEFADRWGWEQIETDWHDVIARDDIDIVDISVPTALHHDIAIEAAKGSPISEQIQEYAFRLGLALLIGIMLFANLNDIMQLIL